VIFHLVLLEIIALFNMIKTIFNHIKMSVEQRLKNVIEFRIEQKRKRLEMIPKNKCQLLDLLKQKINIKIDEMIETLSNPNSQIFSKKILEKITFKINETEIDQLEVEIKDYTNILTGSLVSVSICKLLLPMHLVVDLDLKGTFF